MLIAVSTSCVHHATPVADPEQERIDRLARRLSPVLVTNGYTHAVARAGCGPTDGPALDLYLFHKQDEAFPPKTAHIRVQVSIDPQSLSHQHLEWKDSRGPGTAVLCAKDSCDAMTSGRIDFGVVKPGKSAEGELDLRFTNDVRVRQQFHARWRARGFVCG